MKLIRETSQLLTKELGRIPNHKDIAAKLGMTERSIRSTIATVNTSLVSMDADLQEGDGGTIGDLLTDVKASSPEEILEKDDVVSLLKEIVEAQLNEREQTIIRMRYGFDDGKPKTLEQVSEMIGRTRERVRQIQHQALKNSKLKMTDAI